MPQFLPLAPSPLAAGRFVTWCVGIALLVVATARPAAAQQLPGKEITTLPDATGKEIDLSLFKDARKLSQLRGMLLPLLGEGKATGDALANFEKFALAKIAEFTWQTKETTEQKRMLLKREIKLYGGSDTKFPDLHDFFNATMLRVLPPLIADEEIALDVRYNWVLLLGQLDKLEFIIGIRPVPDPVPESTTALIDLLHKQDLPESLRVGAWVGLARQAESKATSQARQAIVAEATKAAVAAAPQPGFSMNGHHWIRKLALQSMAAIASTGKELDRPDTVKLLYDVIKNDAEPLFLRREAVLCVGNLDPAVFAGGPTKPADLLKAIGTFTLELTKAGSGRNLADPNNMAKAENVFPPPVDGDAPDPKNSNKKLFADGVGYYLNCVATALGGRTHRGLKATPGLDKPTSDSIDAMLKHINPTVIALGVPYTRLDVNQMPRELQKLGDALRQDKLLIAAVGGGGT